MRKILKPMEVATFDKSWQEEFEKIKIPPKDTTGWSTPKLDGYAEGWNDAVKALKQSLGNNN
jgi:hypothetical protein